jgi:hypothetical protein
VAISEYIKKYYGVDVPWTDVAFNEVGSLVEVPPDEIRRRILECDAEDFKEEFEELLNEDTELYDRLAKGFPLKIYHQEYSEDEENKEDHFDF